MSENDNQLSISNEDQRANARGRGHGRGAAGGKTAARHGLRRYRQQEDTLLQIQRTSNNQQLRIPLFTARRSLQVQLPNNAGLREYLSLFLTDEFFYWWNRQTCMRPNTKHETLICLQIHVQVHG